MVHRSVSTSTLTTQPTSASLCNRVKQLFFSTKSEETKDGWKNRLENCNIHANSCQYNDKNNVIIA